jgi:hypothetical protein
MSIQKFDDLARSVAEEGMSVRLTIEAGADGVVMDLQIIVSGAGGESEVGFGIEGGGRTSEAALELLLHDLDAGGLDQARAFRDERLRKAAMAAFEDRRSRKRQLDEQQGERGDEQQ